MSVTTPSRPGPAPIGPEPAAPRRVTAPEGRWSSSTRRGPRAHAADAVATYRSRATGRSAFAVADGVGDSAGAAFAATLAADHAVRVAAIEGSAAAGIAAAGDVLRSAGDLADGDAAMVLALELGQRSGTGWEIAWVGDCRAVAVVGRRLRTLTRDHTVAAVLRALRMPAGRRMEHVLATSVRTARPSEIEVVRTTDAATLLLVSDGVHRALDPAGIDRALAGTPPALRADALTSAALAAGGTDNAAALVVDAR